MANYVLQLVYQVYTSLPILQYTSYVYQIYNAQHNKTTKFARHKTTELPNMQVMFTKFAMHNTTELPNLQCTRKQNHQICKLCLPNLQYTTQQNYQICNAQHNRFTKHANSAVHNSQFCIYCNSQFCNHYIYYNTQICNNK